MTKNKKGVSLTKYLLLAIACFFTFCKESTAQTFANTDFEYGVYKSQPRKWSIEGEGENYSADLDSTISYQGKKSLHISLKNAQIFIFIAIPSHLIAGKTIEVNAFYKSSENSLNAMLLFNSPTDKKTVFSTKADPSNKDWQPLNNKASFPKTYPSDRLLLALTAQGNGEFWFDHVQITIDGKEYGNAAADFREPSAAEIKNLNNKLIPIKGLDVQSVASDIKPLSKIIKDNTILALGENSHGSSTIYKLKLKLIKYLVEQQKYTVFALEMPTVEADNINDYIQSGRGSKSDVIKNLTYPSWQTHEMVDIIEWIKAFNTSHEKKVAFRGFDMQNGDSALLAMKIFAQAHDHILLEKITELEQRYATQNKTQDDFGYIDHKAKEISIYLGSTSYAQVTAQRLEKIRHYASIFIQSAALIHDPSQSKSRDICMAENIDWIVKNSGPETKIIVSGDNTHISKASGKMGSVLSGIYNEKYLAVGFTYNTGSYSAYGAKKYYEVYPSYPGTYEYLFSKSRSKNFILDIRKNHGLQFLNHPSGFRSIGSRPQETTQFAEINITDHFDIVIYIEHSDHTTRLQIADNENSNKE